MILFAYIVEMYQLYQMREHFLFLPICALAFALVWIHVMVLFEAGYFLAYCHTAAINFTCTTTLVKVIFLKLNQCYAILQKLSSGKKHFRPIAYLYFRSQFSHTLVYFFKVNALYGRTFFAYLLAFVPINVALSVWAIQNEGTLTGQIVLISTSVSVSNLLFVIHLLLAMCSPKLHRPRKQLLSLMAQSSLSHKFKMPKITRFRLLHQIYVLHTKRPYGFTYGSFGLVSLSAFAKVKNTPPS